MENTDAYQTAFAVNPCLTECAVEPSNPFKAEHSCPANDLFECIRANVTASVELRYSMTAFRSGHSNATVGPVVTPILEEYCQGNPPQTYTTTSTPSNAAFTQNEPTKLYTTIMTTITSVTPTTTPTPPQEKEKDSTLGLGLEIGIPTIIIAFLACIFPVYARWKTESTVARYVKRFRNRGQPSEGLGTQNANSGPLITHTSSDISMKYRHP